MSMGTMTCGKARRLLWPDRGLRPASRETVAAQEHLAGCRSCQQFVHEMRALGEVIHDGAPREQAPAAVRDRLFSAVARARSGARPPSRGRRLLLGALAVALLAVAGGAIMVRNAGRDDAAAPIAAIAEDHARAVGGPHIISADLAEVTRWLQGHVQFAMHVPALPGARLRGARVSEIGGGRAAVVEYQLGSTSVGYFVVPNDDRSDRGGASPRFHESTRSGYHVVWWHEAGLLHAMIGNTSEAQLTTLAKACVEQMRRVATSLRFGFYTLEG
jgi:anti-sigma factor RsiW